jgi:alpha-L-rhamnosidase
MKRLVIFLVLINVLTTIFGQQNPKGTNYGDWENLKNVWDAWWISDPSCNGYEYGVFQFRKNIWLDAQPARFIIHVSADNRYQLFVNGTLVSRGPARGELQNWQYETIDIAQHLTKGSNTIAAKVFNFGSYRPSQHFSHQTAFILQSDAPEHADINTNNSWKVFRNQAYTPLSVSGDHVRGYYTVGPCDSVDGKNYPWGWETPGFDDTNWANPKNSIGDRGTGAGFMHGTSRSLVKRTIPLMEEKAQKFAKVVRLEPEQKIEQGFLKAEKPLKIEANTKIKILIDNQVLDVGYPELHFSEGKNAVIRVEYAEALFDEKNLKGNRNEIDGKSIAGAYDVIVADGGKNRKFSPLWLRTFRYVQLEISTSAEPLYINNFSYTSFKYPFEEKASTYFEPQVLPFEKIWETGWRTARLCANETYWDCPYYEQLQYIGDTRIQALISLYVAGDDRLMRNALIQFNNSITGEGLTKCNAPNQKQAIIPPFSLAYIGMLHDFMMHRDDVAFLKPLLPNIEVILAWFDRRMQANGLLGPVDWWPFVDWTEGFFNGIPTGAEEGNSTLITLVYAKALNDAADIFTACGQLDKAKNCKQKLAKIEKGVNQLCFDTSKGLYADTPEMKSFSQHANVLAVLSGVASERDQSKLIQQVLNDESLIQCSLFYKFYLMRALAKLDMGEHYFDQLKTWKDMLDLGLTTFPETAGKSNWQDDIRSDCHAWSASVCYDFLSIICGINPLSHGFKTIKIAPAPGKLSRLKGDMPHPNGIISVDINITQNEVKGSISLPQHTTGIFCWENKTYPLKEGNQTIIINPSK